MTFNPKWIVGKRVARVVMNPFRAREGSREMATDPVIVFDDGSSISFVTHETDGSEYGTDIVYSKPQPEGR